MMRYLLRSSICFCAFLFFFMSINAHAGVSIIVTAPPPLREVIVEPAGYTTCYIVPQGFYNGIWHYRHRVCEYDNNPDVGIWVAGYWQCTDFLAGGRCTRTSWVASHWTHPRDREYRRYYDWNRHQHRHHENRYSHGNNYQVAPQTNPQVHVHGNHGNGNYIIQNNHGSQGNHHGHN